MWQSDPEIQRLKAYIWLGSLVLLGVVAWLSKRL